MKRNVQILLAIFVISGMVLGACGANPPSDGNFVTVIEAAPTAIPMSPHAVRVQYDYRAVLDSVKHPGIPGYLLSIFDNRPGATQLSFELRWDNGTADTTDDTVITLYPSPVQTPFYGTLDRLKEAQILLDSGNWKSPFEDTGENSGTDGGFILYGPKE